MTSDSGFPPLRLTRRALLLGSAAALAGCRPDLPAAQASRPTPAEAASIRAAPATLAPTGTSQVIAPNGVPLATARWVQEENARPGSTDWVIGAQPTGAIEGYADRTSAVAGDTVTLFVSTRSRRFTVAAWRLGWYAGTGGRLVWRSPSLPGRRQPAPTPTPDTNLVECRWKPSAQIPIDGWPPGVYLLVLAGSGGEQQYVPLTVRDDGSRSAYLVQNSVTTWQAYNRWDGYSLYGGPADRFANRARVVSFDRPYTTAWANGAADLLGNEYPLIALVERRGLDVSYWTDLDLHQRPHLLRRHRALLSLGHDEYWSGPMYDAALAARDAGLNLAFLGANACYRHIRLEPSPVGPDRQQVCYKVAREDPLYGVDDAAVTANWPAEPDPRPASILIGSTYQSNPVDADLVVTDAGSWLWAGSGVREGTRLAHTVGSEYDGYSPGQQGPPDVQILGHSPVRAHGRPGFSDVTWVTVAGGGGVFDSGTNWWVSKLTVPQPVVADEVPPADPVVRPVVTAATLNLLAVLGAAPGSRSHPSSRTWPRYYH